ncbi:MAG: GTP-binding protein [Acidimicrobiales bacterium]
MTLPLTVIGGYLGAGKTTLVNRLLTNAGGRRVAVLVNDFGDIAVDAALIEADDGDTISFANGCVCCSLADGFAAALGRLRERSERFDHVVVEVSGVGNPGTVAQWGHTPGFTLDAVIVLADATSIRTQVVDPYVGETVVAQLEAADLVVVTKLDLVDEQQETDLRAALAAYTDVPLVTDPVAFETLMASTPNPAGAPMPTEAHATHLTRTTEVVSPLTRPRLLELLGARPEGVVRVKGVVRLAGEDQPVVVQVVGRRVEVTPATNQPGEVTPAIVAVAVPGTAEHELDEWIATLGPTNGPASAQGPRSSLAP